ncbi:MAG TPA: hypothetical protein VIT65_05870 [Microlunatus sp.]
MPSYLSTENLTAALQLRDLTDPDHGTHAMQQLLGDVVAALTESWAVPVRWVRTSPLVAIEDNYDRLGFDPDAITREARYTRYVSPGVMLRSHTTAAIPWLLRHLAPAASSDELIVLPGLVYRRDAIDRTHVGEPHQVDLWRLSSTAHLGLDDLTEMLATIVDAVLPCAKWRVVPAVHPYTVTGQQLEVLVDGEWLELAECGVAAPRLIESSGLDDRWSGLALGMGLDRALMLRKGIGDIRALRATEPRIRAQMSDLSRWRPVSTLPAVRRDISIVIAADQDDETIGDKIRASLAERICDIESVTVLARTVDTGLPEAARDRLGITAGQVNALVRIVIRPLSRTLTDDEANQLRDQIYLAVHEGRSLELITPAS